MVVAPVRRLRRGQPDARSGSQGAVASLASVAKLPFKYAKDGISYTFSIVPGALGKEPANRENNLVGLMDGYFHHERDVEGVNTSTST